MDLKEVAKGLLQSSLNLQAGEKFLVVTDPERRPIGEALFEAGRELEAEAVLGLMLPRPAHGAEPPEPMAAAMLAADVVVAPTTHSLTHTQARRRATERGARVATMPGITEDMFRHGAITADYNRVKELTQRVSGILDGAKEVRIVTQGHELRMSIEGRRAISSTGVYHEPGQAGNLPSGESFLAPVEGTTEGELLVDGSIAGIGRLSAPVLLRVAGGRLVAAEGEGPEAGRFLEMLDVSPDGRNVAELGIGTNDKARLTGIILEDEKIYGTVHVAFGSNDTFGGRVKAGVHLDAVVLRPEVYVDGRLIVSEGEVRV